MAIVSNAHVYHLQEPWLPQVKESWVSFGHERLVALAQEFWNDRRYTKVAAVKLYCGMEGVVSKLNYVFRMTNSAGRKWWDSAYVTSYFIANGCRSTSAGDVIKVDGEFYVACAVGFEKLTDGRAPLVIPNLTKSNVPKARLNDYWLAVLRLGEAIEAVSDVFIAGELDDEVAEVGLAQHRERMAELTHAHGQLNDIYTVLSDLYE